MEPWLSRSLRREMDSRIALEEAEAELHEAYAKIEVMEQALQKPEPEDEEDMTDELKAVRERAQELQAEVETLEAKVKALESPSAALAIAADTAIGRALLEKMTQFGDLEKAVRKKTGEHHDSECPRRVGVGECSCALHELTRRLAL